MECLELVGENLSTEASIKFAVQIRAKFATLVTHKLSTAI